jgi:uncharacterized iron-regulated membrane protein
MTRGFWLLLHRWIGLAVADFLIVEGLTGALLAFLPELNHWLTPHLYPGPHAGVELDMGTLALRAEALAPNGRATTVYLGRIGTARVGMEARVDSAPLDFDYLCLDPVTGEELGRLRWNEAPTSIERVMPFVYSLHETLAMGSVGEWILGFVALAWTIDCFIAFYLTLPSTKGGASFRFFARWRQAWMVKLRSSFFRINFDIHRAGGLWLWALLFVYAWSSVCFNMNSVYTGVTRLLLDYDRPVWAQPVAGAAREARAPIGWSEAQSIGERLMEEQALARGFSIVRPLALYALRGKGLYEYRVRSSLDIGDRYGSTALFFDAYSGELRRLDPPVGQHVGNTLTTWLLALHMANVFGLPYRILVVVLGLGIVALSVTGVYIWWRKRAARRVQHWSSGAS